MSSLPDPASLEKELRPAFDSLTTDPAVVDAAIRHLGEWFTNPLFAPQLPYVAAHVAYRRYALLLDSFYQYVPFGTGGRRGRVGYGPNRINTATVALSVQGHCDYIRSLGEVGPERRVVVACDVRVFNDLAGTYDFLDRKHPLMGLSSHALARLACEVYAGNGIVAYLPPQHSENPFLSTPELSFLIRQLSAAGGINVSASHNHPDDNGFKFYTAEGAQDIPPRDEEIAGFMNRVTSIRRIPFDEAAGKDLIRELGPDTHRVYVAMNVALRTRPEASPEPIVYTPLCGTGDSTVGDVLRAAGYRLVLFEPQSGYDGTFASIPSRLPNPEIPRAAAPAVKRADEVGSWLIFSTDPDADRLGVLARTAAGQWRHMTGNEIAATLAHYLILDREHGPRRKGIVIKTLVTTRLIEEIARAGDCQLVGDLLVGFKYIANVLSALEREGRFRDITGKASDMVLAAEESHGVLLTPEIRDKDAAGGALLLAELYGILRLEGLGLPDYFDRVALAYGNYASGAESLVMRGIEGSQILDAIMKSVRTDPPAEMEGMPVLETVDYLDEKVHGPLVSDTDRFSRNLLVLRLRGADITIRPSGTEPKMKVYVDLEGRAFGDDERESVLARARALGIDMAALLLERVGIRLSPSAWMLPDFVDVGLKQMFDREFTAELLETAAELAAKPLAERKEWLRERLALFGAGADPLDVAAPAVVHLCRELGKRFPEKAEALAGVAASLAGERTQ